MTRNHAVLGTSEHCIAGNPGDLAVALVAFDAVIHLGVRQIAVDDFFLARATRRNWSIKLNAVNSSPPFSSPPRKQPEDRFISRSATGNPTNLLRPALLSASSWKRMAKRSATFVLRSEALRQNRGAPARSNAP
ncbi:hypothetical protein AJ87_48085 [Rhizobium yanglingense]|nr:hypothetical protein AJ87_48085 [Rhizobium yanglingense]